MARTVIRRLPLAESGAIAVQEMHAPFGIPDLTVVIGDPSKRAARLRLDVPPLLNEIDAGIVAVASAERPQTPAWLANRVGWSLMSIKRRLPHLLNVGALREDSKGRLSRPSALTPIGTVYAIELKVSNWNRGLTQCRTYRTWADSYILIVDNMPDAAIRRLKVDIRGDRGGLVVGEDWVTTPKLTRHATSRRLWASEYVIAASRRPRSNPPPLHTA